MLDTNQQAEIKLFQFLCDVLIGTQQGFRMSDTEYVVAEKLIDEFQSRKKSIKDGNLK